ncbi:MAG TPA: UDP-4-amino-4,6-dideoxy-N-acetyl-beta-L-altrosamine transaminase, partial [Gammaproteobacteria bacterium]|nr:UDP-4-amino-4,6-dideoxy-N-acetyl-beta-L-altrosamine transaminase [Gammaproteobacteria bacterium]
ELWKQYQEAFSGLPVVLPCEPGENVRHGYHLYALLVDVDHAGQGRDAFIDRMTQKGIGIGVHYLSIPEHPYYQERFGWQPTDYPEAMKIGRTTVSLPLSAKLSDVQVDYIIDQVKGAFSKK